MKEKAIFLDRDGVINKVIFRDGKPCSPRILEEFVFNGGIKEAIHKMKELGYRVFVVSNQPDIARGMISQEFLDRMNQEIWQEVPVDDIFICPHDDHHDCSCRKPKPGLLLEAAKKWKIDLLSSFMIGDTWKDMEAGKRAGCRTILLETPYNQDTGCDYRVKSLREAIEDIIEPLSNKL